MAVSRRMAGSLVVVVLLLLGSGAIARGQVVDAEDGFVAHIAQERSSRGLGTLAFAEDLQVVARRHAQRMADRGEPYHNGNLGSEVQNWEIAAENVGVGPSVDAIHRAFMQSTEHRDIILHPDLTQIGVGVVETSDGKMWVVEVFRKPKAPQQAQPEPEPQPQPQPQAEPEPQRQPAPAAPAPVPVAPTTSAPPSAVAAPSTTVAPVAGAIERSPRDVVAATAGRSTASVRAAEQAAAPIVVTVDVAGVPADLPAQAWVAAFMLAGVVGFQGQALRRLGLVA